MGKQSSTKGISGVLKMSVKLFDAPNDIDKKIVYLARVSSEDQANPNYQGLIKFLIREGHWSPFDMVNISIEVNTQKDIAIQLLRHPLMPQEWSQRYADCSDMQAPLRECRLQDVNNRQNSLECLDVELIDWWIDQQKAVQELCFAVYDNALKKGIAKEVARAVLPIGLTNTKMYFNGTIRQMLFYCKARLHASTQKEHRLVAEQVRDILYEVAPITAEAFFGGEH